MMQGRSEDVYLHPTRGTVESCSGEPNIEDIWIVWPDFDPYPPNGLLVMARIDELIAKGMAVDAPLT
jgi:hypothetical protein